MSLLAVCALQQALKVASSGKLTSESRTSISAYTAGVLARLIQFQIDPELLCHVIVGIFQNAALAASPAAAEAADKAAAAEAQPSASRWPADSNHAEHAAPLQLPTEGQPLASLLGFVQRMLWCWQNRGRILKPEQPVQRGFGLDEEQQSSKKRKKSQGGQDDSSHGRSTKKHQRTSTNSPAVEGTFAQCLAVEVESSDEVVQKVNSSIHDWRQLSSNRYRARTCCICMPLLCLLCLLYQMTFDCYISHAILHVSAIFPPFPQMAAMMWEAADCLLYLPAAACLVMTCSQKISLPAGKCHSSC